MANIIRRQFTYNLDGNKSRCIFDRPHMCIVGEDNKEVYQIIINQLTEKNTPDDLVFVSLLEDERDLSIPFIYSESMNINEIGHLIDERISYLIENNVRSLKDYISKCTTFLPFPCVFILVDDNSVSSIRGLITEAASVGIFFVYFTNQEEALNMDRKLLSKFHDLILVRRGMDNNLEVQFVNYQFRLFVKR